MKKHHQTVLCLLLFLSLVGCSAQNPAASPTNAPNPASGTSGGRPAWAGLHLTGHLVLIQPSSTSFAVVRMDLDTGKMTTLFQAQEQALVSSALVSPDGKQILLAYAPPASAQNQLVYTSLYLLPAGGDPAGPKPIFSKPPQNEAFFAPAWSADGQTVYTSHYIAAADNSSTPAQFTIDRVSLDGKSQTLLKNAEWPSLSTDGARIAYVSATPSTSQNELYLANLDGSNPKPAIPSGTFPAVDDHFFAPDSRSIVFSAVNNLQPTPKPTFFDRLFGIRVVSAHNVPSDWYRVTVDGGKVDRLTNLNDTGMYAALSPDKTRIAFIAQSGLYVMNADGSQLTQLNDQAYTGTVDWKN